MFMFPFGYKPILLIFLVEWEFGSFLPMNMNNTSIAKRDTIKFIECNERCVDYRTIWTDERPTIPACICWFGIKYFPKATHFIVFVCDTKSWLHRIPPPVHIGNDQLSDVVWMRCVYTSIVGIPEQRRRGIFVKIIIIIMTPKTSLRLLVRACLLSRIIFLH